MYSLKKLKNNFNVIGDILFIIMLQSFKCKKPTTSKGCGFFTFDYKIRVFLIFTLYNIFILLYKVNVFL